jgi:hypothetical protein
VKPKATLVWSIETWQHPFVRQFFLLSIFPQRYMERKCVGHGVEEIPPMALVRNVHRDGMPSNRGADESGGCELQYPQ